MVKEACTYPECRLYETLKGRYMQTAEIIRATLPNFTGTTRWFRHGLARNVLYTEGVQYLAEAACAYWLVDVIASYQGQANVKSEPFQCWKLRRKVDTEFVFVMMMTDGNSTDAIVTQTIGFSDFPLDEIDLWVEEGDGHMVILLPSEH